jgi:heme-degrading monooxygenase HmoA
MIIGAVMNTNDFHPQTFMWEAIRPIWMEDVLKPDRYAYLDGQESHKLGAVIATQRIAIPEGMETSFESEYAPDEGVLRKASGFKGAFVLRRDGQQVGGFSRPTNDDMTHMALSVWKDKDAASEFALAHPAHKMVSWEGAGPTFWEALLVQEGDGKGAPATSAAAPKCERRRRLQSAVAETEADWLSEWQERVECWWMGAPNLRDGMGACAGALSLHLASRFQTMLGATGGTPATQSAGAGTCDTWMQEVEKSLPAFPALPETGDPYQWQLPALPPLLPTLQRLNELQLISEWNERQQPLQAEAIGVEAIGFGLLGGALGALGTGLVFYKLRRNLAGRRLEMRRPSPMSPPQGGSVKMSS